MSRVNDRPVSDTNPMPIKEVANLAENLSLPFVRERSAVTLAVDGTQGDTQVTLEASHGVSVGEVLEFVLTIDESKFLQAEVTAVATDLITLDQQLPRDYPIATSSVVASSKDMLVVGTRTAPIVFSIKPLPTQAGLITRMILEMRGTGNMDFITFGGELELTNGCYMRIKNPDGTYKNLFNFKSNSDFFEQGYDHDFLLPAGGQAVNGFVARVTWAGHSKQGAGIHLDGSVGEELQIVIQDDLATGTNSRFHLTAQGYEIEIAE